MKGSWAGFYVLSHASREGSPTNQTGYMQRQDTGSGILWSVNRWTEWFTYVKYLDRTNLAITSQNLKRRMDRILPLWKGFDRSWTFMTCHRMSPCFLKHFWWSKNVMKHHQLSHLVTKSHQTSPCFLKRGDIWWFLVTLDDISLYFVTKWWYLSWYVMTHHGISWVITNHFREVDPFY